MQSGHNFLILLLIMVHLRLILYYKKNAAMKKFFIPILLLFAVQTALAQDIIYADVEKSDIQRMNFEILGKVANNYLVFKEVKGKNRISVYDESMRLLEEVPLNNLPKKEALLDLSFFPGRSSSNLVYQYQDGDVVNLMSSKVEANGRILGDPKLLDTTTIGYNAESKIYNTLSSEDGSRIMLFKINRRDRILYNFTTRLYDNEMNLLSEDLFSVPMEDGAYRLGSYNLTNDGKLIFTKYSRVKSSGNIDNAFLIEKAPGRADFKSYDLGTTIGISELFLDDIKVKVDENNGRYLLTSLYSNTVKGGMDGIYVSSFDKLSGQRIFEKTSPFDENLRQRAKAKGTSMKSVFNDYFINNVVVHDDGSFTVGSEALYSSGGDSWNRWGYWGGPMMYGGWGPGWGWGYWNPYRFYSPFFYRSYWWGGPWGSPGYYGYGGWSSYHADNVAIVSFDKNGNKTWDNVIIKRQDATETDGSISYQILSKGNNMHFLLNNSGKISSLEDITIQQNGTMRENEPIGAKDKNIDFMPRYAKQVGPGELIVPYRYKNNISFAKVII